MEKLTFLVEWAKDKERTWSGTCFSLYESLQNYYEVKDKNLSLPVVFKVLFKILGLHWFNVGYFSDFFNKFRCRKISGKVFQFAEIKPEDEKTKTFIYQDLSCSYIAYMKNALPDIFEKSGYIDIKQQLLEKRIAVQNNYYEKCSAIFTMGHWLKDFMVSQGIQKEKVFAVGGG